MFRFLLLLFLILLIIALLSGCQTRQVLVDAPVAEVERVAPQEALVRCPKAGPLTDTSFGSVVRKLHEVLGLYDQCSSKHGELADFIERTP